MTPKMDRFLFVVIMCVGAITLGLGASTDTDDGEGFSAVATERSVHYAVQQSPNDYLAGVVESIGALTCVKEESLVLCRTRVRVITLLASKRTPALTEFDLVSGPVNSEAHEPFLVFVVPMANHENLYGATSLGPATESEVEKLRSAIKAVLGE